MVDPGFPRGGGANPRYRLIIWTNFFLKLHENLKKLEPEGGASVPAPPPLDPPITLLNLEGTHKLNNSMFPQKYTCQNIYWYEKKFFCSQFVKMQIWLCAKLVHIIRNLLICFANLESCIGPYTKWKRVPACFVYIPPSSWHQRSKQCITWVWWSTHFNALSATDPTHKR